MSVTGSVAGDLVALKAKLPSYFAGEADRASGLIRDEVRKLTPVGRIIDPKTGADMGPSGQLRNSIRPLPTARTSAGTWRSGAYSSVDHASHQEYGTRRHVINGKPYLAFWTSGRLVITKRVMHPGNDGHHMFLLGAQEAERLWQTTADSRLQQFLRTF